MWRQKPSFRFEIDNFLDQEAEISSETFVSGGCESFVKVHPKGDSRAVNHLALFLFAANPESLQTGWKKSAQYYFVVLTQSNKELYKSAQASSFFNAKHPGWGYIKTLPVSKLKEKGVLENDKLIIEFYINVTEAVDGEGEEDVSKKNETVEINEHPDISEDIKLKNKAVKTTYMNVLLKLIAKLNKSSESLSETKLTKAINKLSELMNVGFNLGWLKSKLDEISSLKKIFDESRAQKLEERIKNLEVLELDSTIKIKDLKTDVEDLTKHLDEKTKENSQLEERLKNLEAMELDSKHNSLKVKLEELEEKIVELDMSDDEDDNEDDDEESWGDEIEERVKNLKEMGTDSKLDEESSRAQQLELRLKNLELLETDLKFESLKTTLSEASLERKKEESRVQGLEDRLKNLELKYDEVSLERKKENYDDVSQVKQLEERFTKLESMMKKAEDADSSRVQQIKERPMSVELRENGLNLKIHYLSTRLNEVTLDTKKYDAYGSCLQKLEGRLINLEEASLERNNSEDADRSRVEQLEVRFNELEFKYGTTCKYLKSKFENDSLERKKTHDADVSRIQKLEDYLEDNVENLELMVSGLKDELGKKKDKSSADGFMLVD